MTIAPRADRVGVKDVAGAVAALGAHGLRRSSARRLVLEALFAAPGPASAEHLAQQLDMEPGSVYRTLETLERHGIVHHVHLGHGPGLYAVVTEADRGYLYCDGCRQVIGLTAEELEPIHGHLRRRFGYQARFDHFPIVGLCATCAAQPVSRPGRPSEEHPPDEEHSVAQPHSHEHEHDGAIHEHPHTTHAHEHTEHEHGHSHGDHVHAHAHTHEKGLEQAHGHSHQ